MSAQAPEEAAWSDVYFTDDPEPTITYRTALAVYEESMTNGRFVGRGWNASGFVNYYAGRTDPGSHWGPQAFWLEVDGQLLASDWEWIGFERLPRPPEADQVRRPYDVHTVVTLKHAVRPVTVKVHTGLDGTAIVSRWLEVTNTGSEVAALAAAYSWSGVLQHTARWRSHLPDEGVPLYSIGYMDNPHAVNEGDFQWFDLPAAGYRVDGRYRRDRHRHPMFVLRNNATGEHFIGQLAWSGGYSFEFDLDADPGTSDRPANLFYRVGPDGPPPQRVIEAGETITTPDMHMGVVFGDLDAAIQEMHDHLRKSVFHKQARGVTGWVISGIGPEIEMSAEAVNFAIDASADYGTEVFLIDAGWYAPPHGSWAATVGDWEVDRQRYPDGLGPFRDRCHDLGMLFGLWMEPERVGAESRVAREHPDWLSVAYDGQTAFRSLIDLTNPAAAQWMEDQIVKVIEDNELDLFRLDYNVGGLGAGAKTTRHGFVESGYWRYYEASYDMYARLRARFPDVIFQNCASGGGRTDIGHVRDFCNTWVTDWQIAPRAFSVTNGMTMALPPEYVDRLVAGQAGHTTAELDFQLRLLLFVRPTIAGFGFHPDGAPWNAVLLERVKRTISLYKDVARPIMDDGRMYHHTPSVPGPDPHGWGVLEIASRDRARGICGLFQLSGPTEPEYLLRPRGLDVSKRYRVTFDNVGRTAEIDGATLATHGITVRLEGALTSELLVFEETN